MIAVGIDVSKSKSTVAILNSDGNQRIKPYDMKHNHPEMNAPVLKYVVLPSLFYIRFSKLGHSSRLTNEYE